MSKTTLKTVEVEVHDGFLGPKGNKDSLMFDMRTYEAPSGEKHIVKMDFKTVAEAVTKAGILGGEFWRGLDAFMLNAGDPKQRCDEGINAMFKDLLKPNVVISTFSFELGKFLDEIRRSKLVLEKTLDESPTVKPDKVLERILNQVTESAVAQRHWSHATLWDFLLSLPTVLSGYGDGNGKHWYPYLVKYFALACPNNITINARVKSLQKYAHKEVGAVLFNILMVLEPEISKRDLESFITDIHKRVDVSMSLSQYLGLVDVGFRAWIGSGECKHSNEERNKFLWECLPDEVKKSCDIALGSFKDEVTKTWTHEEWYVKINEVCKVDLAKSLAELKHGNKDPYQKMVNSWHSTFGEGVKSLKRKAEDLGKKESKKTKKEKTPLVGNDGVKRCFICNSSAHLKQDCPQLKEAKEEKDSKNGNNPKKETLKKEGSKKRKDGKPMKNKKKSSDYLRSPFGKKDLTNASLSKKLDRLFKMQIRSTIAVGKLHKAILKPVKNDDTSQKEPVYTTDVYINGKAMEGVCDSYATHTFANKAFVLANKLGPLHLNEDVEVKLGNGEVVHPYSVEVLVGNMVGSYKKMIIYVVDMKSKEPELIIGLDLFGFLGVNFSHRKRVFLKSKHWNNFIMEDEEQIRKFFVASKPSGDLSKSVMENLKDHIEANQNVSGFSPVDKVKIDCKKMKNIRAYNLPVSLRHQIGQKIKEWYSVRNGRQVIEDSDCVQHSLPLVIVRKKNGKLRICLDLRFVNENTSYDTNTNQTIPKIKKIKETMRKYKLFAVLDVEEAFNSLELDEESRKFTTFLFEGKRYQFRGVPFGLHFLPAHFQEVMEKIFVDNPNTVPYLDDIVIGGDSIEELTANVQRALEKLTENKFKVNMEKSVFATDEVRILGSIVSHGEVHMDKEKLLNFDFQVPRKGKDIERLLGFVNWFGDHIPLLNRMTSWLSKRSKRRSLTDAEIQKAAIKVRELKEALFNGIPLSEYDPEVPLQLATDASREGISGVLFQDVLVDESELRELKFSTQVSEPEESSGSEEGSLGEEDPIDLVESDSQDHQQPVKGRKLGEGSDSGHASRGDEPCENLGLGDNVPDPEDHNGHQTGKRPKEPVVIRRYLGFFSKVLKDVETRYPITKLECLAVVKSVQHFHEFLFGQHFTLLTDHKPLEALFRSENQMLTNTVQQWLDILMEYSFDVEYIPGVENQLPDKLSRLYWEIEREEPDDSSKKMSLMRMTLRMRDDEKRKSLGDSKEETTLKETLLKECHTEGGHYGIQVVLEKIHDRGYTWKDIREDIGKCVAHCPQCRKYNLKKGFHPMKSENRVFPLSRISCDVIGPIKTSVNGYKYIFVTVDNATKFVWLRAVKNKKSETIAEELFLVGCQWGFPKEINFDGGSEFAGEVKELLVKLHVDAKKGAPYNPHSTGSVEAQAKIVFQTLRKLTDQLDKRSHWDECVIPMMYELNNKVTSITRSSPFELMYGRKPACDDNLLGKVNPDDQEWKEYWDDIMQFVYPEIFRVVEERNEVIRERYNLRNRAKKDSLHLNDLVMLETIEQSLGKKRKDKLSPLYSGPYIIIKVYEDGMNFGLQRISDGSTRGLKRVPTNRLKKAAEPIRVKEHRRGNGECEYLIEWESGEDFWLTESEVSRDLLETFYEDLGVSLPKRIRIRSGDDILSDESSEDEDWVPGDPDSDYVNDSSGADSSEEYSSEGDS